MDHMNVAIVKGIKGEKLEVEKGNDNMEMWL